MTPERAAEIITAYGGDPARWPAAERAAALALAGRNPALAAALAAARDLDSQLATWALDVPAKDFAPLDLATPQPRPRLAPTRWWAGAGLAALAAAVTGLAVLAPPPTSQIVADRSANLPIATPASANEADFEAFATLFTPTADEDELI